MAEATVIKTKRDGTLTIKDNGGSNSYVIAYEDGSLTLNIPGPQEAVFLDRGQFGATPSIRYGDDQPITGTFTANMRDVSDASYVTLVEFLTQTGSLSTGWTSTLGSSAEAKVYTLQWDVDGTTHGESTSHQIICNFCKFSGSVTEGVPNVVSISFTSYDVYPTVT